MAVHSLCYLVVTDDDPVRRCGDSLPKASFWYTKSALQNVLQLVGCKVHHAVKISRRIFDILEKEKLRGSIGSFPKEISASNRDWPSGKIIESVEDIKESEIIADKGGLDKKKSFGLHKDPVTLLVQRAKFVDTICSSLEKYHYVGPSQREDVMLACRLRERKESVTVLLCGTSGCGKSTLSSLLASRLGITTVVSTDSVRHMMRSFTNEKCSPLLWASTYHAGEFLDPVSLAEAKARKKAKRLSSSSGISQFYSDESVAKQREDSCQHGSIENLCGCKCMHTFTSIKVPSLAIERISCKELAIEGYKAQSEMVIDRMDHLITMWEQRRESVVIEGVHLSLNFVMGLMKKHPSIIPFLIYISNEEKHLERFAVRAKYMTLDPSKNKYVKYIKNIRTIQDYLCKRADKHLVPKVNNTNVDRSVASIHSTIFSCLRKRHSGLSWYDATTNTAKVVNDEYHKQCDTNSIGSKGMFRIIQRHGSLRRYMAIVNNDGIVTKAWPFSTSDKVDQDRSYKKKNMTVGDPIYGPMHVCEVEPANIQFGNFGIGSWPNDIEGTSYAISSTSSRGDPEEESSRYSSTESSFHLNGHAKEPVEDAAVSESGEEQFDDEESDLTHSDREFGDDNEMGASVIESPVGSDDDFDEVEYGATRKLEGYSLSKQLQRTTSIKPSTEGPSGGRRLSRFRSMPLRRSRSRKASLTDMPEEPSGPQLC